MKRTRTNIALMLAACCLSIGCLGGTHTVTVDAETARLDFGIVAVQLEAGDGQVVDFCVVLNDSICGFPGGEVIGCGLDVGGGEVTVFCADPLLAEWPNAWTLNTATWSAPSIPASGNLLVEPANMYILPSGSSIITDPGYSAYVVRLDLDTDFGPADVNFSFEFDHNGTTEATLKGVEVLVAEIQAAKVVIPIGDPVIDFPNLPTENVIEVGQVATEQSTWGWLKSLFK